MQIVYSQREAHSLSLVLVTARVVTAVTIDGGNYGNSGWLCVLMGLVLCLPLAIAVDRRPGLDAESANAASKIAGLLLAAVAIFEAAAVMRLIVNSISYSEMLTMPVGGITFLTLLGCFYAIGKNGSGICNAAKVWIYIFALIFAIVLLAQFRLMEPRWLLPVLGPGLPALAEGAVAMAGYLAAAPMIHSLAVRENKPGTSCTASMLIAALAAALLCALRSMMAPALTNIGLTRFLQFDNLISNGRQSLSLQLPLLIALHSGLIVSLAGYGLVAAGSIQRCFKKAHGRVCAAASLGAVALVCMIGIAESDGVIFAARWEFVAAAAAILTLVMTRTFGRPESDRLNCRAEG